MTREKLTNELIKKYLIDKILVSVASSVITVHYSRAPSALQTFICLSFHLSVYIQAELHYWWRLLLLYVFSDA